MCRILVADDEEDFRKALAEAFRTQGHEVRDCASVPAGLAMLNEEEFEVVISDLSMPGGSGLDLLAEAHRRFPQARLILVSWLERPAGAERLPFHRCEFVRKPVPLQILVQSIESFAATGKGT